MAQVPVVDDGQSVVTVRGKSPVHQHGDHGHAEPASQAPLLGVRLGVAAEAVDRAQRGDASAEQQSTGQRR
jgi:hypothetical protein